MIASISPIGGSMKLTILKIITIVSLIPVNTVHSLEIAKREGVSGTYSSCSLTKNSRTLSISEDIRETVSLEVPYKEISSLSDDAINNRGIMLYRWSSIQENYFVNGERFYAYGLESIINESTSSKELISIIDEACERDIDDFRIIGHFTFSLKIGRKIFQDKVEISLRKGYANRYSIVRGNYTVPNSFTAKIFDLNYESGSFSFKIHVLEGDDDYIALFEGSFLSKNKLRGKAFILPSRKELGSFYGERD